MAYKTANPTFFADTKDLQLTVNGKVQLNHMGEPIMDEKAWLKLRKTGIGGSDTASILGISPWRSKLELYDDKVGNEPRIKANFNSMAKDIGHMAEPYIRYQVVPFLLNKLGVKNFKIEEDSRMFRHGNPEYSFAIADVDGLISVDGKLGILELKTTNFRNRHAIDQWNDGIVPPYYMCQLRHYMAVMNLDFAYICCSWGLNPMTEATLLYVERNLDLEEQLMDAEKDFWENNVLAKKEPDDTISNPSTIVSYAGRRKEWEKNTIDVDCAALADIIEEREAAIQTLNEIADQKKAAEVEVDYYDAIIAKVLDNKQHGSFMKDKTHKIDIWAKPKSSRASYDAKAIMVNEPGIFEKGIRFAATDLTNAEKAKIKDYKIPGAEKGEITFDVREIEIDPKTGKAV